MFSAKIIKDSTSPFGKRITTMEISYPRFVHSEFMTHRDFSRNAGSSRAIPITKMIDRVEDDPAMPIHWGKNQPGMQANEELEGVERGNAILLWQEAKENAIAVAKRMNKLGVHKQIVNRLLEPFMNITVIVTATEWSNFFALRCHPEAQPEIRHLANLMYIAYMNSVPEKVDFEEWHLPYIWDDEKNMPIEDLKKLSVARCARVSYLTHDGKRDHEKDYQLYNQLSTSGHWSPFEHVAQASYNAGCRSGNFVGWIQYRKSFSNEYRKEMPIVEIEKAN